jgi:hypothetical protein
MRREALESAIARRDMRSAVRFTDLKIHEQRSHGFRAHAAAAVGMQRQCTRDDALFVSRIGDDLIGELGRFTRRDHPADDVAAEDIEDDVQMEAGPFRRTFQLCYIPRPDFIGSDRQQLRLRVGGVHALLGRPVIWTCKRARKEDMHFDTRQYNHILWDTAADLGDQLYYRIIATI